MKQKELQKDDSSNMRMQIGKSREESTHRKTITNFLIGFVLGFAFYSAFYGGYVIGQVASPTFDTIIEPGSMRLPADFIIFTDGTNFYARNGTTGAIDIDMTTLQAVLNSALDTLPSRGGIIDIAPETYRVDDLTISGRSNIVLRGERTLLWLQDSPTANENVLYIFNSNNITVEGFIIDANGASLANIGNIEYQQNGIVIRNSNDTVIRDVEVRNFRQNGIYILHDSHNTRILSSFIHTGNTGILAYHDGFGVANIYPDGILIDSTTIQGTVLYPSGPRPGVYISGQDTKDVLVMDSILRGNDQGMRVDGSRNVTLMNSLVVENQGEGFYVSTGATVENIALLNNQIIGNAIDPAITSAVYINHANANSLIQGNMIIGNDGSGIRLIADNSTIAANLIEYNGDHGIYIQVASHVIVQGNIIRYNAANALNLANTPSYIFILDNILGEADEVTLRGANLGDVDNVWVIGNTLYGSVAPLVAASATGEVVVRFNTNIITERCGEATILNGNSQVTVTHGLFGTPSTITLSGSHGEVDTLYSGSIGGTTFTIFASGGAVSADRVVSWCAYIHYGGDW